MGKLTEQAAFIDRLVSDLANQTRSKDLVAAWASKDMPNPEGYVIEYTDWGIAGGQLKLYYRVKKHGKRHTKGQGHRYSLVSELRDLELLDVSLLSDIEELPELEDDE